MAKKKEQFYIKRDMAINLCFRIGNMQASDIAEIFNISRSLVSKILKRNKE